MSILSDIKDKLYPEDFDVWEYENAPFQSRKDYLSFEQTLKLISQPPKKTLELVLKEKYDQQLSLGSKRRQKLKRHREFLSASRGLMYMSFIVSLISPFVNFRSGVSETAIIAAIGFSLSTLFFSNSASKISKQKIEKETVSFITSSEAATFATIFNTLHVNDVAVFACEADGKFKRIKNNFWAIDNCRLAFFTDSKGRRALALNDNPPSGELLFLRSEVVKLFPENQQQERYQNSIQEQLKDIDFETLSDEFIKGKIWRKSDNYKLQRHLLRSQINIYDFLQSISNNYDLMSLPGRRKLSPTEIAIVSSLIFILNNFSIWIKILENHASKTQIATFRQQLLSIFSASATGPRTTLKGKMEPGEEAANRLIRGNYPGLERWLQRTKYTI